MNALSFHFISCKVAKEGIRPSELATTDNNIGLIITTSREENRITEIAVWSIS